MDDKYIWEGVALLSLLVAVWLIGCDGAIIEDEQAATLSENVAADLGGDVSGIRTPSEQELGRVRVYVDRSLSMKPYLEAGQDTDFRRLLRTIDNLLGGQASFRGFGFPEENGSQTVTQVEATALSDARTYSYANNDYADLIARFEQGGASHLLVSDGVQSVPKQGERFSDIVSQIGQWTEQDGVFALMSYRAPYEGDYFNEVGTQGNVDYDCEGRPLHVFGFFPSSDALDELLDILRAEDLAPAHLLRIGGSTVQVTPADYTLSREGAPRGERVLMKLKQHTGRRVEQVASARVQASEGYVPLQFKVALDTTQLPWQGLSPQARKSVLQNLEPSLMAYRVEGVRRGDSLQLQKMDFYDHQDPTVKVLDETDRRPTARVSYPVRPSVSGGRQYLAWVLTLRLSPSGANRLVPAQFSTRDDTDPSACTRTLNLRSMMGAVLRENYVASRALLITEWTG